MLPPVVVGFAAEVVTARVVVTKVVVGVEAFVVVGALPLVVVCGAPPAPQVKAVYTCHIVSQARLLSSFALEKVAR